MADTVSQIESNLTSGVTSTIDGIPGLTTVQRNTLNTSANQLSAEYAPSIVNQVTTNANGQVTTASQDAIGPNNPLDIVNGNLSATDVTSFLTPIVNTPLGSALTFNFVNDLTGSLKSNLSTDQLSGLNLDDLTGTLNTAVSSLMNTSLGTALSSFSSQLMGGGGSVTPFFQSVSDLFSGGSAAALTKIDGAMASSISSKALAESKNFNVKTPENQEKLIVTKRGFMDPTATYPTREYAGRPETNKLATGEIRGTIVQTKDKDRMIGAQLPNGESWDQPKSPFKGEYPYNKVIHTESGHTIELDDSPGAERLHVYHRSGTYIEIDANGSVIKRTKGSSYEIIDRNNYVAINGRTNLSVNGACNIFVGADANIEVEGDTNITCKNDITAQAGGRIDLSAVEEINIRSKTVRIEADDDMHISADTSLTTQSPYINQKADKDLISTAQNIYLTTSGVISGNAGDNVNFDGSQIQMNGGQSVSKEITDAENAAIGLISGRKDISEVIITDPIAVNYMDKYNTVAEDSNDPELARKNQEQQIKDGVASRDEVSEPVVAGDSSNPSSSVSNVILPSTDLLKVTELPGNYQLSKHFTVAMLTTLPVASKHQLQAQAGLTYGQIAYNLSALALNVLEPIKALYPNMMVTSCFRAPGSNPTSQHPKGMAADIQIPGVSKKDYYDIANKLAPNLKYDQFLLEYKTTGTGLPWLHVSINLMDGQTNRTQVMTFLNDKKHSSGLTQLA